MLQGRFIKWAVAAGLLGAGFFFSLQLSRVKDTSTQGSVVTNQPAAIIPPSKPEANTLVPNPENTAQNNPGHQLAIVREDKIREENSSLPASSKRIPKADHLLANTNPAMIALPTEDNKLLADHKTYQALEKGEPIVAQNITTVKPKQQIEITDVNILDLPKNSLAATAGFTNEQNENRILFMSEDAVAHSKAGGLFRRIKRTVERKTKINTGNTLKIAGFEIAIN